MATSRDGRRRRAWIRGDEQLPILYTKDNRRIRQNRAYVKGRHRRPKLLLLPAQTTSGIAASDREPARDFVDGTAIAHEADLRSGCGLLQDVIAAGRISAWVLMRVWHVGHCVASCCHIIHRGVRSSMLLPLRRWRTRPRIGRCSRREICIHHRHTRLPHRCATSTTD